MTLEAAPVNSGRFCPRLNSPAGASLLSSSRTHITVSLNSRQSSALCPVRAARRCMGGPPAVYTGSHMRIWWSSSMMRGPRM